MQNLAGKQFDRYRILSQLGQGGMAMVYRAYDTRLDRDVALKVIRTDAVPPEQYSQLMQRFDHEAKAQAQFAHPNIVPVYDYGQMNGSPYLVMAFVSGGTLKEKMGRPVPYRQALGWVAQIAGALSYAHQMGVVHRDIKPGNILFGPDGRPVLTDFGIAKILETNDPGFTSPEFGMGTPGYMAPEQYHGHSGEASDQYALGVVLYELLTGRKPYSTDKAAAIARKQIHQPLPSPRLIVPGIPAEIEQTLFRALSVNPGDRFPDMAAFHHSLALLMKQPEQGVVTANTKHSQNRLSKHPSQVHPGSGSVGAGWPPQGAQRTHPPVGGPSSKQNNKGVPDWVWWAGLGALLFLLMSVWLISSNSRDDRIDLTFQLQTAAQAGLPEETAVLGLELAPTEAQVEEVDFAVAPTVEKEAPEPNPTKTEWKPPEPEREVPEPSPTKTEANLPEPTNTPRAAANSSSYITPTPRRYTPIAGCAQSQLRVGDSAFVNYQGGRNHLRSYADTHPADNIIGQIMPGEVVIIIGGPVCNHDWLLWEVETTRQEKGWTPETDGSEFWLLPLTTRNICSGALPTRLVAGHKAKVNEEPPDANLLRPSPSRFEERIGRIPPGNWMLVLEGPVCGEGTHWWRVEDLATGTIGWTMEGSPDFYYLSPEP